MKMALAKITKSKKYTKYLSKKKEMKNHINSYMVYLSTF